MKRREHAFLFIPIHAEPCTLKWRKWEQVLGWLPQMKLTNEVWLLDVSSRRGVVIALTRQPPLIQYMLLIFVIIGLSNGLSPVREHAIAYTNADVS